MGSRARPVLTAVHLEVLQLMSLGLSNEEIAGRMDCSISTTAARVSRCYDVLSAVARAHAVGLAMASGLITGPEPVTVEVQR